MKTKYATAVLTSLLFNLVFLNAQDMNEARELIETERYSSAEQLLEKNVNGSATPPEVNFLLVKTYLEQDKKNEAGEYVQANLQSAVSTNDNPMNRLAYARYLFNTGNSSVANEIFSTILSERKNRNNSFLLLSMAEVAIDEKDADARPALEWLDMAERRDKNNPDIDIARGLAWRKLGDASNAYLSYQSALKKDKDNPRAHYLIGKIFTAQKNPEVYMEHFMKAYDSDSTYAPVLEELYNHYYYRNIPLAKKYLEKYIAHSDYSIQNQYYLADIYYLNGEYPAAVRLAGTIVQQEGDRTQPRLYKLMAYSYAKDHDSIQARRAIGQYFEKQDPAKCIAADFELRAQLTENLPGAEKEAIACYEIAFDMDTIAAGKATYAAKAAALFKKMGDAGNQALWLGKVYQWKEKTNNMDLFNWGLAHYTAGDYVKTDSVFALYTQRYPEDIFGYYWRAQATSAIDTSMDGGLAVPFYQKVAEIGEKDKAAHKKMLLTAYGYLGGYEANITKDYAVSLSWFEKYLELESDNATITGYAGQLRKWIEQNK